jgi:hypothetical protein
VTHQGKMRAHFVLALVACIALGKQIKAKQ